MELCSLPALYLGPNYGGGNEDNGDLLLKIPCMYCCTQCPQPCTRPPPTHAFIGEYWTLTGKPGSVSCGVIAPLSWVLVHTRFCLCPPRVYFPFLCKFWQLWLMATSSKRAYAIPKSASPRASVPAAAIPPQETLTHSSVSVSVESLGPGAHKVYLSPLSIAGRNGVCF